MFKQKNQTNEVKEVKHIMKILLKSLHNVKKNGYNLTFFHSFLQLTHTKQNLIKQKRDKG